MLSGSKKASYKNSFEYAYQAIKEEIMSFELVPETFVSSVKMAEKLQISSLPIKVALTKLQDEHLVDVIPQVGTYVTKIKKGMIDQATFMRITLEKEGLKLACESFPDTELVKLKKNVAQQEFLLSNNGSVIDFNKLDIEFHEIIFRGIQKVDVWDSITRLSTHYNRFKLLTEMAFSFKNAYCRT